MAADNDFQVGSNRTAGSEGLLRATYLEMPRLIIQSWIPKQKVVAIRRGIEELAKEWASRFGQLHGTIEASTFGKQGRHPTSRPRSMELPTGDPWRLAKALGIGSPLIMAMMLFSQNRASLLERFEHRNQKEMVESDLKFYEFLAVILNDFGRQSELEELARYHAWMAQSYVDQLKGHDNGPDSLLAAERADAAVLQENLKRLNLEVGRYKQTLDRQRRRRDPAVVNYIKLTASDLYKKNKNLSRTEIANRIKKNKGANILISVTTIREIIGENCPQI